MMVLITYDVETITKKGQVRLRKISKVCVNYGQRVQNSVFEVNVSYGEFLKVKAKILDIIDEEKDSVRFYYLGNDWQKKVEHVGAKETYDPEGVLII